MKKRRFLSLCLALLLFCSMLLPASADGSSVIRTEVPGPYTVTVSCGKGGTYTVTGAEKNGSVYLAKHHTDVTVTFVPDDGYTLGTVTCDASGGTVLGETFVTIPGITEDVTVSAVFEKLPAPPDTEPVTEEPTETEPVRRPDPPIPVTYRLSLPTNAKNGTVTADKTGYLEENTQVTLYVTPNPGFSLEHLTVTAEKDGSVLSLTDTDDGAYFFRMPASDVSVSVTFDRDGITPWEDCPRDETCIMSDYTDLDPEDPPHDGIHFCLQKDIIDPDSDTVFGADTVMNTSELLVSLYRLLGSPAVPADADADKLYGAGTEAAAALSWAYGLPLVDRGEDLSKEIEVSDVGEILYRLSASRGYGLSSLLSENADRSKWALAEIDRQNAYAVLLGSTDTSSPAKKSVVAELLLNFEHSVLTNRVQLKVSLS